MKKTLSLLMLMGVWAARGAPTVAAQCAVRSSAHPANGVGPWVVDHVVPLCKGGPDIGTYNGLTAAQAKDKP